MSSREKIMQFEIEREAIRREKDKEKESNLNKLIAELSEKRDDLKAKWDNEKSVIQGIRQTKEEIDQLRIEAEQAERSGDLGKVAEIRYGKVGEKEAQLKELQEGIKEIQKDSPFLRRK